MKKIFLFAVGLLLAVSLSAQTDYKLAVAGVNVTSENASDVFAGVVGQEALVGKVSYNEAEKTLTLDNAEIEGAIWYHPAWSDDSEIVIKVKGFCYIHNAAGPAIKSEVAHTKLLGVTDPETGMAKLKVYSSTDGAIRCWNGSHGPRNELKIESLYVTATSEYTPSGVYAVDANEVNLLACVLDAQGPDDKKAVYNYPTSLTTSECDRVYEVRDNMEGKVDYFHITYAPESQLITYPVEVKGKRLNQFTADDVLQDGSNVVQWNNVEKTMSVVRSYNIYYSDGSTPLIEFLEPATLSFHSEMGMSPISFGGKIRTQADLKITGQAAQIMYLNMYEPAIEAASAQHITITFEKTDIEITGETNAIGREVGAGSLTLVFKSANVHFLNRLLNVSSLDFDNCSLVDPFGDPLEEGPTKDYILTPQGLVDPNTWDELCSCYTGEIIDAQVQVPNYPVTITGIPVNAINCEDVLGDGKVAYDPTTATLTLADGANLYTSSTDEPALLVFDTDLTVICEGQADLHSLDGPAVRMNVAGHNIRFVGKGNSAPIKLQSDNWNDKPAIEATGCGVTLDGIASIGVSLDGNSDSEVIVAKDLTVNCDASFINTLSTTTHDAVKATATLTVSSNLDMSSAVEGDLELVGNEIRWTDTSKPDKIIQVYFEPKGKMDLYILGKQINAVNMDNPLGDGTLFVSVSGSTYIVTITNAHVEELTGLFFIEVLPGKNLKLQVRGQNYVKTLMSDAILADQGNVSIIGQGDNAMLYIEAEGDPYVYDAVSAIRLGDKDNVLDIQNVTIEAVGLKTSQEAINTIPGGMSVLNILDANLRAAVVDPSGTPAAISKFNTLVLGSGVTFLTDNADWPLIKWVEVEGFMPVNVGDDLSHIWIGKDATFPTDVETVESPKSKVESIKVLRDGQLLIIRDGKVYNAVGARVE